MRTASTQRPKDVGALPIPPQPRFGTNEPEDASKDEGNVEEEEEVGAGGASGLQRRHFRRSVALVRGCWERRTPRRMQGYRNASASQRGKRASRKKTAITNGCSRSRPNCSV